MTYKLYLDDIRNPPDGTWVVARSMAAAVQYIAEHGYPHRVSFDHDLGMIYDESIEGEIVVARELEAPTGYDFAKWLCAQDQESPWMSDAKFTWTVHSANPVGAENIRAYLTWYKRQFVD